MIIQNNLHTLKTVLWSIIYIHELFILSELLAQSVAVSCSEGSSSLELASDAVVGLLQVGRVDVHLVVESVQLLVLTVQLTAHVSGNTLQVGEHVRHCPGRQRKRETRDETDFHYSQTLDFTYIILCLQYSNSTHTTVGACVREELQE